MRRIGIGFLFKPIYDEMFLDNYSNAPTNIFSGMTSTDYEAKKWIERYMSKL